MSHAVIKVSVSILSSQVAMDSPLCNERIVHVNGPSTCDGVEDPSTS